MPQLTRQEALWAGVDDVLPEDATMDISLILALAPGEVESLA